MTFLELCQAVASESGTAGGGTAPLSVSGQSGRLGRIVGWVRQAWTDIQNERSAWRWMEAEWQGNLIAGQQRYDAATFSLTRHAEWMIVDDEGTPLVTVYDPAEGVSDASRLDFMPWPLFYTGRIQTPEDGNRPTVFSVDGAGRIAFSAPPDKTYVARGMYRKTPQTLAANGDTPEMPARFHRLIVSRALVYLGTYDEAAGQLPAWDREVRRLTDALERDQLPQMRMDIRFA